MAKARAVLMRLTAALCAATVLAATAACSGPSASAPEPASASPSIEVFTWWGSGSEKLGLDALVSEFTRQHPDVPVSNGATLGGAGSAAKDLLRSRLTASDPPDTFQAHAGAELAGYVAAGELEKLDALADQLDLADVLPPELLALLTVDGSVYAVPAGVHRANMLWANRALIASTGVNPDAPVNDVDGWIAKMTALRNRGVTPLVVGTTWTQVHLLETILLSDLGAEAYRGLWDGTTDWSGPDVAAALEDFATVMSFANDDRDSLDWEAATQRVIDGGAAYMVMGDWAATAFTEGGWTVGDQVIATPVPGSDDDFDVVVDTFTVPVGAPNHDGAVMWLRTVASLQGQIAFNKAKGSIPARSDVAPVDFTAYQRTTMADYVSGTKVPSLAHGTAVGTQWLAAITSATGNFTTGESTMAEWRAALIAAATTVG